MFTDSDYHILNGIVFQDNYPGYRPNVVESPGGEAWDTDKRYANVVEKYIEVFRSNNQEKAHVLESYLTTAHEKAEEIAIGLGVSEKFMPVKKYGTLRVLEYPPGAICNPHVDYCLFTTMCYRNIPEQFVYTEEHTDHKELEDKFSQSFHIGQILELIIPEHKAMKHQVVANHQSQYSIIYLATPDRTAVLPNGMTVDVGSRKLCPAKYKYLNDDDASQGGYVPW